MVKDLARKNAAEMIAIRHHLHANPELSYQEFETSKFIQQQLKGWGISFQVMATTGVVAIIEGKNPASRVIALRADMDALPIQEENNVDYRSKNDGVMHACGHDVHTTCLLGAAKILQETKMEWEGTVKLIFQPGEEKNPGGASLMIAEGVLQNPTPERIIALHVHPGLENGHLSFRGGMAMASADEIYIRLEAAGGHAAAPHLTADPILVASHLVIALQQMISRVNNPIRPSVLSITSIQGGHATNVIPSEVKLMGTFRAMDENWRNEAHQKIKDLVISLSASMGVKATIHIDVGYPFVKNDEPLTEMIRGLANEYQGESYVHETELRMGAEDFAYYTHHIPGCFFRLGVRNESKGIVHAVHTPRFDIDESAIELGMGFMAYVGMQG
jgi:hippurate hydrolase